MTRLQDAQLRITAAQGESDEPLNEDDTIRLPSAQSMCSPRVVGHTRNVTFAEDPSSSSRSSQSQGEDSPYPDSVRQSISSARSAFSFINILRPRTPLSDFTAARAPTPTLQATDEPSHVHRSSVNTGGRPLSRRMTKAVRGFFAAGIGNNK